MVFGVLWTESSACYYRAIDPMRELERRGHEVIWPLDDLGGPVASQLDRCDVVHVYRRFDEETQRIMSRLGASGTGIVWDADDDLSALPKESPDYKRLGGLKLQHIHRETVKTAARAHVATTTTQPLATRYTQSGIERVEVIGNFISGRLKRRQHSHDGIVIGWIAGIEHRADIARVPIANALQRLLGHHPDVRVECIGVDLKIPERYRHDDFVPFLKLPDRIGAFDIAIAPLADIPFNATRSDIKVKEYAACGIPWLASPVGPYADLGEEQGGRLVSNDGWFDALDRLVASSRDRRRLARQGTKWAKRQRLETEMHRWEAVFEDAKAAAADHTRHSPAGIA